MEESFNPLDLLECDVVEGDGEVQIPDVNKDGTENKNTNSEMNAEVEGFSPHYLQTPEPIFDLLQYSVYEHLPVAHIDGSKNPPKHSVQEFIRPRLMTVMNPPSNVAFKVSSPTTASSSAVQQLPQLTAAPTAVRAWNPSSVPTMPKLVPIPRPILSTGIAPPVTAVNVWNSKPSEVQAMPSTSVAASPPVKCLEKDPLAIRSQNAALLCSHAETAFRCELQRHISKYSVTFFRLHCTSCGMHIKSTLFTVDGAYKMHKFLRVLVCQKCSEYYGNGYFPIEEGSEIYCFWCGNGGNLYCCSSCQKTFCEACVIRNFGFEANKQISQKENWTCFVCDFYLQGKQLWAHRAIPTLLQKHIKHMRSEASLLEGDDKTKALNQDFSLCCMGSKAIQTIEVALPYSLYSKIPQHLVTSLYKLVCKPGTEPGKKKIVVEETRPGCVSVGQKSETENHQLVKVNMPISDITRDSSLASTSSLGLLSKVLNESEQFINDFKMRLSYCNIHSNNMNNLSVSCVISNLESLFKEAIGNMKKISVSIKEEKKRILPGDKSNVVSKPIADKKKPAKINEVKVTDNSKVDPLLLSEPKVFQMENKENQFNENNVDMPLKTGDSSKVKVSNTKKKQGDSSKVKVSNTKTKQGDSSKVKVSNTKTKQGNSSKVKVSNTKTKQSSTISLSRKRKLETFDNNDNIMDYNYLFKKYKMKNCSVVLKRTDCTNIYNLKKCNVVLKKTNLTHK